jgi:hypothetical protein
MSNELIPFGKYKGQPIESIKDDQQYLDWLLAQSWFVEKHRDLYTIIINNFQEPTETPQHNAMHVKFLRDDYIAGALSKINSCYSEYSVVKKQFECRGWDVIVEISKYSNDDREPIAKELDELYTLMDIANDNGNKETASQFKAQIAEMNDSLQTSVFYIEIKPSVSDDFPSVLRQIKAQKTGAHVFSRSALGNDYIVLLIGEYSGIGATKDEFVAFMKNEGIIVVFDN